MAYKILYLEDLNPETKVAELRSYGYDVDAYKPSSLEETLSKISIGEYDAFIFAYKLTANREKNANKLYNAPTVAQTLRSTGFNVPIILVSSQKIITESFNADYTSQDFFDFCVSKENFSKDIEKYCKRIDSFIKAYKEIEEQAFNITKILKISNVQWKELDYRFKEQINMAHTKTNVYAICRFIHYELLRSIGPLIGEDVLSARLGISKKSKDWDKVLDYLKQYQYNGILSDVYRRWWWFGIEQILKTISSDSLRLLSANDRVKIIKDKLNITDLIPIQIAEYAQSDMFWSICKITHIAIDPNIDGFDARAQRNFPWQEKEFVSAYGVLNVAPLWLKKLDASDRQAIRKIAKNIAKDEE